MMKSFIARTCTWIAELFSVQEIDPALVTGIARCMSNGEKFEDVAPRYEGALSQVKNHDELKKLIQKRVDNPIQQ